MHYHVRSSYRAKVDDDDDFNSFRGIACWLVPKSTECYRDVNLILYPPCEGHIHRQTHRQTDTGVVSTKMFKALSDFDNNDWETRNGGW